VYPSAGAVLELSARPPTAAASAFREDQLAWQSQAARGVKCHVSCDMARYGMQRATDVFKKKKTIRSGSDQKPAIHVG
jgi:hypothetical protein